MQATGRVLSMTERPPELIRSVPSPTQVAGHVRVADSVRRHLSLVWRILRRAGLRPADADDAAQDVFWILAQRVDGVPVPAEKSFLISTALRVASDRRRSKWNRSVTEVIDPEYSVSEELSPEEALGLRDARALLDEALSALDPEEREVFLLLEMEQMTRDEVAAVLGLAPGTVASRMRRAREAFEKAARKIRLRDGVGAQ